MKIALITDTHAGARNDSHIFNDYFLDFFENQFFPFLEKENIKKIIHLGDVFDRRKYLNFHTLHTWRKQVFDYLERNNIQMDIIVGNHDVYWKNTNTISSVEEILRQYKNIKIYSSVFEQVIDNIKFIYVPWINSENTKETLEAIKNTDAEILLGHLEIKGFQMHRGALNTDHGFEMSDLSKFDFVMSGHFHHKSNAQSIYYLGNPYEMFWHDWNDTRGFHVFDTQKRKLIFHENKRKIFHKIFYNDENKSLEEITNVDFQQFKNMYVKVVVEEKTNPSFFDIFLDKLQQVNPQDVKVVEKIDEGDDFDSENLSAKDTLTILNEHIESMNLQLDKKKLTDLMSELYHDASNLDVE